MDIKTATHNISIEGKAFKLLSVTNFDELYEQLLAKGLQHEDVADERIPYWAELWPAAVGLATHIFKNIDLIKGKSTLEIGCGLGLPALVAASTGAHVTATDYLEDAVAFAAKNAALNDISSINFKTFDWRMAAGYERFDVLLASDVAYERSQFEHLEQAFKQLVKPNGLVLLSEPDRYIAQPFLEGLAAKGYNLVKYAYEVEVKDIKSKVSVYEIKVGG